MTGSQTPLSSVLPPLICGTATFTAQYNRDPYALPTTEIVHRALSSGIRAFDTSPYYGPAEELLGRALDTAEVRQSWSRPDYFLLTKAGRITSTDFDYSAASIRSSVHRSLERLRTSYVDVVYCHDVEFVSSQEVLSAVRELRKMRDASGILRYVGISGYPVTVLCELAELVLRETGEPLDAVMSYANFTLQNTTLQSVGIPRLQAAGVEVVPNASPLGMGLLRRNGVPLGAQGDFHPAQRALRAACREASAYCDRHDEKLEVIAIEFALGEWLRQGQAVGSSVKPASGTSNENGHPEGRSCKKLGVSVIGVSFVEELDETMAAWRRILEGFEHPHDPTIVDRRRWVQQLSGGVRKILGRWLDYSWPSPGVEYIKAKAAQAPVVGPLREASSSAPKEHTVHRPRGSG